MVVGHVLIVHTCPFLCTHHVGMTVHTTAILQVVDHSRNLFYAHSTSVSTSGSENTVGHGMITEHTDLAMAPVMMVIHPSINWAHSCLTSANLGTEASQHCVNNLILYSVFFYIAVKHQIQYCIPFNYM